MSNVKQRAVTPTALVDDPFIDTQGVLDRVPLKRETIWRLVRDNKFPRPIALTTSKKVWRLSAVLAWMDEREKSPLTRRPYVFEAVDKDDLAPAAAADHAQ